MSTHQLAAKSTDKIDGVALHYSVSQRNKNSVADALSRRPHTTVELQTVSSASPAWFPDIIASYQHDEVALKLVQKLTMDP